MSFIQFNPKFNYNLTYLSIRLIGLFLGFFLSTALSTIPAQTGDWTIITGSLIVCLNEIISRIYYKNQYFKHAIFQISNCIRIGIIYGLFVDSFKLGS
uniref:Uncharacterized protein ycf20 n=1 Tax=Gelidium kathyanniae TaxID=2483893 RepID=A0A3G2QXV2_9FLOR|nr:hypothetical protein [Gelidium kathyanniae]AYO27904.1 hypothetical protein [Gelidium kathyanniae]